MSTEPTPVASYDATGEALEQSGEEKPAGMMADEFLMRAYEHTTSEPGDAEADALFAGIARREQDI